MDPNLHHFLAQLGLSPKEIQLYLASLKYGPQTATVLARKTGLPRSTINFIFSELVSKGFATKESKASTSLYDVIDPEAILYMLEQKKAQLKKLSYDFEHLLPLFKDLEGKGHKVPKLLYFEGVQGLCRVVDDHSMQDQSVWFISSHNNMHPKVRAHIETVYIESNKKHRNKNRMVVNDGPRLNDYLKKAQGVYESVVKVDPKETPFKLTTAIYGDKVAMVSYDPEDMSGVIIQNQLIAEQMRTIYKVLEKALKKT